MKIDTFKSTRREKLKKLSMAKRVAMLKGEFGTKLNIILC